MNIPSQPHVARAFGEVLATCRRMANITQEELADRAGMDRTYPSLLERGLRQPTIGRLIAIAMALNMEPSTLVLMAVVKLREIRP
jgi:transcriptional regulator with XRE-family HTH domain